MVITVIRISLSETHISHKDILSGQLDFLSKDTFGFLAMNVSSFFQD